MSDGCEWNPVTGRAAFNSDAHHFHTPATVIVGADGRWRLCGGCAKLPEFKRFRVRRPIVSNGNGRGLA